MQVSGIQVLFEGRNFLRIFEGLFVCMRIAVVTMALSLLFVILLGLFMDLHTNCLTVFFHDRIVGVDW